MRITRMMSILGLAMFVTAGCNAKNEKPVDEPAQQPANAEAPKADSNTEAKGAEPKDEADNKAAVNDEKKTDEAKAAADADNEAAKADNAAAEPEKADDAKADADADKPAPEPAQEAQSDSAGDSLLKATNESEPAKVEGTVCEEPEGCDCNGVTCPMNAVCGESCLCGGIEVPL